MTKLSYFISVVVTAALALALWQKFQGEHQLAPSSLHVLASASVEEPIAQIPVEIELDNRRVELGRALFKDPQLSKDGSVSCASCHDLAAGGVDHRQMAIGIGGAAGS